MLRVVARLYIEGPTLELVRRDAYKGFRTVAANSAAASQTVLSGPAPSPAPGAPPPASPPPSPPTPPPPQAGRRGAWGALVAALAASVGGVYWYKKNNDEGRVIAPTNVTEGAGAGAGEGEAPYPAAAEQFPAHVQYLVVGGGTAAFAALRALRAARPTAQVLLVTDEPALPYMRPPLSKELWAEPALAAAARSPDTLTFRQWNGRRRALAYEPPAFYTPVERLAERPGGGVGVARGWRVTRVGDGRAELCAPGRAPVELRYDKCLLATGVRPRRVPALHAAAAAGRSLAVRDVRDVARLAELLDRPDTRVVAVVGGGFLACELTAALADRLSAEGKRVVQLFREEAAMARVLPRYLALDAGRRLRERGAELRPGADVLGARLAAGRVLLQLAGGAELAADVVVECAGAEPDVELARRSGLELDPERGGVLVNAELQARADLWAAGDVACFYDELLGRRRVEHHDHAVVSGRLAGENMAGVAPPRRYHHQSMFWSDLGPQLGYEAIGIIDSSLPTVGVFAEEAVSAAADASASVHNLSAHSAESSHSAESARSVGSARSAESSFSVGASEAPAGAGAGAGAEGARYERGVVFYTRERRVVGVLLWNLFNRMHIARQVLAEGEFSDLLEVGKLFAPHLDPADPADPSPGDPSPGDPSPADPSPADPAPAH